MSFVISVSCRVTIGSVVLIDAILSRREHVVRSWKRSDIVRPGLRRDAGQMWLHTHWTDR